MHENMKLGHKSPWRTSRLLLEEKATVNDFGKKQFPVPRNTAARKIDHKKIFVYGNVVYAQTWEVSTLKTCIEPP